MSGRTTEHHRRFIADGGDLFQGKIAREEQVTASDRLGQMPSSEVSEARRQDEREIEESDDSGEREEPPQQFRGDPARCRGVLEFRSRSFHAGVVFHRHKRAGGVVSARARSQGNLGGAASQGDSGPLPGTSRLKLWTAAGGIEPIDSGSEPRKDTIPSTRKRVRRGGFIIPPAALSPGGVRAGCGVDGAGSLSYLWPAARRMAAADSGM